MLNLIDIPPNISSWFINNLCKKMLWLMTFELFWSNFVKSVHILKRGFCGGGIFRWQNSCIVMLRGKQPWSVRFYHPPKMSLLQLSQWKWVTCRSRSGECAAFCLELSCNSVCKVTMRILHWMIQALANRTLHAHCTVQLTIIRCASQVLVL